MIKKIVTDLCCINNSCKKVRLNLESFLGTEDECIEGFLTCTTNQTPIQITLNFLILVS
jgi:hypothetical protein